ncbi:hypothetical protein LguiA_029774 [Lonicera macranthoides]
MNSLYVLSATRVIVQGNKVQFAPLFNFEDGDDVADIINLISGKKYNLFSTLRSGTLIMSQEKNETKNLRVF